MDIYYFYNGINNIINLVTKNKKYLDHLQIILNDPLVILDFKESKNLKGGASLITKGAKMFGKKGISNKSSGINDKLSGIGSKITNTLGINNSGNKKENNNSNEKDSLSIKEKGLNILKILFLIVYYLCLFSILPLIPFILISYYSFKRLKIFYNNQMSTL
jgi:hypothetical protein